MIGIKRTTLIGAFIALASLATAAPAAAHCDSLDGPVVEAAREALATGEVERVLIWVRPGDEAEIRDAYAGLQPAGYEPPAGIEAADRALGGGSIDDVANATAAELADALRERFQRVLALRDHDPADVEAGRRYVHAYVEYIHFVEAAHELLQGAAH